MKSGLIVNRIYFNVHNMFLIYDCDLLLLFRGINSLICFQGIVKGRTQTPRRANNISDVIVSVIVAESAVMFVYLFEYNSRCLFA